MAAVPPSSNEDITVVIANYNYARFLQEAVTSLAEQAGGPPRIIVVDDGSTERETHAILDALEQRGVTVVRQRNRGASAARNTGLALVDTPYWLVLDADDLLAPGALAAMRSLLDGNPQLSFAFGFMRFFGDMNGIRHLPEYDPYGLLYRHAIGLTALARAAVLRDTGGYDAAFAHYEDWEFWVHALAEGHEGGRVAAVTLEYRRHAGTKFADDRRNYRAAYRSLREKHAGLYAHSGELAVRSTLGPARRALHRWFWGPRPIPARAEAALHRLLWRPSP